MRTTFFKLWVHIILRTPNEYCIIDPSVRQSLIENIERQFIEIGCPISALGGADDHLHILFEQNPLLSLHETVEYVKKTSAYMYHKQLKQSPFNPLWAEGFVAFSVSASQIAKVVDFIENQADIHEKMALEAEIKLLNSLHQVDEADALAYVA